ncbi:glucokinase [Lentzea xinjiangensis]|uniref:Glucokinase n=1 Tax=Lentzea xinjiangensis TaxID=402600 RepID=A0A1H9A863_9PSEU|nr:ROK family protein [Lentzea xinjiangensis]SEP72860.1 glucokinase [Lentzea xinjiangensis]
MTDPVLALDFGGTKIAAALVDSSGSVLRSERVPTPPENPWDAVVSVLSTVAGDAPISGVGIASAGPVDTVHGTVSPINVPSWQAFPLRSSVAALFPDVPVELAGDGVCMALGEHWRGAGQGSRFMVGLVVSTGVGGGLVLDGRPFGGRTGNAGHIGHLVVEPDGAPCTCGGRGCVETVAGGPRMVDWARRTGWRAPRNADAAHLAAAALAGEEIPLEAFDRAGHAVGMAIAGAAAICDLELAVIGGGVAQAGELLFEPVRRALKTHAGLSYLEGLEVRAAQLGGEAGLVGAAALVRQAR